MSMRLDQGTVPEGLEVKTWDTDSVVLGDYRISIADFLATVEYVLENANLEPNDPRIEFLEKMQNAGIVPGWGPSHSPGSRISLDWAKSHPVEALSRTHQKKGKK